MRCEIAVDTGLCAEEMSQIHAFNSYGLSADEPPEIGFLFAIRLVTWTCIAPPNNVLRLR